MPQGLPYSGVPEVETQANPTGYQNLNISPDAYGAGIGKAARGLGEATEDTALQYRAMQNKTEALNQSGDFAEQLGQIESDYHQLRGTDAVDQLAPYQKRIRDLHANIQSNIGSPAASLMFAQDTRGTLANAEVRMGAHAGEQARTAHTGALEGSINQTRSQATRQALAGQPVQEETLDDLVSRVAELGHFQGWEKSQTDAYLQKQTGDMVKDMVEATMSKGDAASTDRAQALFDSFANRNVPGTDLPMMDGDHLASISQSIKSRQYFDSMRAEREEAHQAASLRTGITHTLQNATAMVERGVPLPETYTLPSEAEIDQAYPNNPEMAEAVKDNFETVQDMNGFATRLQGATPEQVETLRRDVQPDATKPDTYARQSRMAQAFDHTLTARNRALYGTPPSNANPQGTSGDPANYVLLTHPELQPVLAQTEKDPSTWANYFHAQATLQSQMGVPADKQHALTAQTAQSIAQAIQTNAANAPAQMRGLQQTFGTNWGQAWKDIVVLGKLPPAYQLVGTLPSADATILARALTASGHNGKDIKELMPGPSAGSLRYSAIIDNAVSVDGSIRDWQNSLRLQGFSAQARVGMLAGVKALAYGNVVDRGMDPADAAQAAIGAVTSGYQMLGAARVPVDKYDTVSANATAMLQNLKPTGLQVPGAFTTPIKSQSGQVLSGPGMTPEDYIRTLQATPNWVMNQDGTGLNLMDTGGRLVRDQQGQPLAVPFAAPPAVGVAPNPFKPSFTPPAPHAENVPLGSDPHWTGMGGPRGGAVPETEPGITATNYEGAPSLAEQAAAAKRLLAKERELGIDPRTGTEALPSMEGTPEQANLDRDTKALDLMRQIQGSLNYINNDVIAPLHAGSVEQQRLVEVDTAVLRDRLSEAKGAHDRDVLIAQLGDRAINAAPAARHEILKELDKHWAEASMMAKLQIMRLHLEDTVSRAHSGVVDAAQALLEPRHQGEPATQRAGP